MEFLFDPLKDEKNRAERGLSLALDAEIIQSAIAVRVDDRFDYGEERLVAYGYVAERLCVCVYTIRDETTRIISVRKANERETRRYGR